MFEVLDEKCEPKRGTKYSAYVDLYANEDVVIGAGETKIVSLGVKIDLEKLLNQVGYTQRTPSLQERFLKSHYLEIALRSSLAVKGLIIANGIGVIDLDYPDEIGLIVHLPYCPRTLSLFEIKKGDKVAQCALKEHKGYLMGYESDVIREGGFGSTGEKR